MYSFKVAQNGSSSPPAQAVSSEFCFDTAKSLNEEAAQIAAGETRSVPPTKRTPLIGKLGRWAGEFSVSQADEADTKEVRNGSHNHPTFHADDWGMVQMAGKPL